MSPTVRQQLPDSTSAPEMVCREQADYGPLPRIPGYEIQTVLGRGGMGIVYRAVQTSLKRTVALKMLRGLGAGTEELQRFRQEAEAIARLRHPNFVQIHEIGTAEDQPFFSLEFIEGGSLDCLIQGQPQNPMLGAGLIETLARAMAHSHQEGIVHRDLKPANILLQRSEVRGQRSEVSQESAEATQGRPASDFCPLTSDLCPKITDFGLAKQMESDSQQTRTGAVMGSPSYMAPEQAEGRLKDIGPATDIYALGAILYELLTGRPPFRGANTVETLDMVRSREAVALSRLVRSVPRDLETICLKCLQKEPHRRYSSCQELADDLRRFQEGKPIRARAVSNWERGVKWVRRRPLVASLVALLLLVTAGAFAAILWQLQETEKARQDAEANARSYRKARDEARANEKAYEAAAKRAEEEAGKARAKELEAIRERNTANEVSRMLVGLFQTADPLGLEGIGFRAGREKSGQLTARQLLDIAAKKVEDQLVKQPIVQATMLDNLGNVYRSLGLLDKAGPLLEKGLALRQKHLPPGHEDTATSLHHLAWLLHDQGKFRAAEKMYREALAIRDQRLGKDNLESAKTMFNLAWVVSHQFDKPSAARLKEAEQLFRQVLKIRTEKLGPQHREVGMTLAALAMIVFEKNQIEAMVFAGQAMSILERAENKDAASSGMLDYFFALQARQKGQLDEAEKRYRSVLARASDILGDEHPLVGILLGDFAGLLRKKGDLAGAEKALRQALDIGRRSPLRAHPLMIEGLLALGDYELKRGKASAAEPLFREALDIARQIQRPDLAQGPRERLITLFRNQKRLDEAEELTKSGK
jgi:serine/threonine protein kinase